MTLLHPCPTVVCVGMAPHPEKGLTMGRQLMYTERYHKVFQEAVNEILRPSKINVPLNTDNHFLVEELQHLHKKLVDNGDEWNPILIMLAIEIIQQFDADRAAK